MKHYVTALINLQSATLLYLYITASVYQHFTDIFLLYSQNPLFLTLSTYKCFLTYVLINIQKFAFFYEFLYTSFIYLSCEEDEI